MFAGFCELDPGKSHKIVAEKLRPVLGSFHDSVPLI
jgi:hypothetical protein